MRRSPALFLVLVVSALESGCRSRREAERQDGDQATAEAEEQAREVTLTGATLDAKDDARAADESARRATDEVVGAFRLEQADYRKRLQRAIGSIESREMSADGTDKKASDTTRELRIRRDLLKSDLEALDRSTEPDWATLRNKIERDLHGHRDLPRPQASVR